MAVHQTALVDPTAYLGHDVTVEPFSIIGAGVVVGARSLIRSHAVVYPDVSIGAGFDCGHHVTIRERCTIGVGARVGTGCDVQPDATIGRYARLHSGVFVARGTVVEEFAWLFPGVVLLDDPHPPSDSCTEPPTIRRFAVVGARATVMAGVDVGEGAVVGAGSLVRLDVPAGTVVVGVPAQVTGMAATLACRHGALDAPYPWWTHFRRGYPDGVLPGP